jgi:hypothetical protein
MHPAHRSARWTAPRVLTLVALAGVAACSSGPRPDYARPYPGEIEQAQTLNIQARRLDDKLVLTNTTAKPLPAGTLWVNRSFAYPSPPLAVGESVTLPLAKFRNEQNDSFRAGGFFATERPDRVVQVQHEAEGQIVGLVAIEERSN